MKNEFLYNDKELWDDADLNWNDYGFRNYDAQNLSAHRRIARFTQLDPLTWDYPYYTPYQYAGNEPIANVDLDGLEEFKVLEEVVVFKTMAPAAQTVSAGSSLLNFTSMSINSLRAGLIVQDNLKPLQIQQSMEAQKTISENNLLWNMLNRFSNWLDRASQGSGSYQDYGIVFTGNDNGTMEFKDHAGEILDHIDIGSLFGPMKAANLDPKVFRDLLQSRGGIKYLNNLLEAGSTTIDFFESIKELAQKSRDTFERRRLNPVVVVLSAGKKGPLDPDTLKLRSASADNYTIPDTNFIKPLK